MVQSRWIQTVAGCGGCCPSDNRTDTRVKKEGSVAIGYASYFHSFYYLFGIFSFIQFFLQPFYRFQRVHWFCLGFLNLRPFFFLYLFFFFDGYHLIIFTIFRFYFSTAIFWGRFHSIRSTWIHSVDFVLISAFSLIFLPN